MRFFLQLLARCIFPFRGSRTRILNAPGSMKRGLRSSLLFLSLAPLTILQVACVQLAEVDSTHAPVYKSMIGREFELKAEFLVRGVKRDLKSTEPDYILVMPPPGIGGRYIYDLGRIPAGSRFRIVGVVTRRSTMFPSTEYVISLADHLIDKMDGKKIRIYNASVWHLYIVPASPDEAPQLSEQFFKPLEGTPRL